MGRFRRKPQFLESYTMDTLNPQNHDLDLAARALLWVAEDLRSTIELRGAKEGPRTSAQWAERAMERIDAASRIQAAIQGKQFGCLKSEDVHTAKFNLNKTIKERGIELT